MALTAKPISTIAYNTEAFIKRKLEALFNAGIIEDYRYIFHYGEDGDKDHFHMYIVPNRRLDTVKLRLEFNEIQTEDDKPLGCMPFRSSKNGHWIMYVIHDPEYLKAHKSDNDGDGKIEYPLSDIKTPFEEQLKRDYKSALSLKNTDSQKVINEIHQGKYLTEIAYESNINPSTIITVANLMRLDRIALEEVKAQTLKDTVIDDQRVLIAEQQQSLETLMLNDLEEKTGLDLHSKKRESVFDDEE